jgi:glycosyltransferase involved in cell wall biosynthesis
MLPTFLTAVAPALEDATDGRWAILCVNDGSSDATHQVLADWHLRDHRVASVHLSRNFGHQAAVSVGLVYARGDYIGIMDCDLQDPVDVLVELYRACLRDGLEACFGIRGRREAPWLLRIAYSGFYRIIHRVADHDWPKDAGDFCVISSRCQQVLLTLPEQSRMFRGLRSWVGFKQRGISYRRPARSHGTSKYNLARLISLALQGLIAFSSVPLRLASVMGAVMGLFSIMFGILVLVNRLVPRFTVLHYWVGANPGVATLLVFLSFTMSVLFFCIGIIGEYLFVLLQETKKRPAAIVATVVGDVSAHTSAFDVIEAMAQAGPRVALSRQERV